MAFTFKFVWYKYRALLPTIGYGPNQELAFTENTMKNENQPYMIVGKGQFELSCEPLRTADVYTPTEGNENERSSNIQPPYESEAKHSITSIFDVRIDQSSSNQNQTFEATCA